MAFLRTWLVPRIAFWILWTVWLWCLQVFLLSWLELSTGYLTPLFVAGPPILLTWVGSRLARNPFDTPSTLFWKGSALSFSLGVFVNLVLTIDLGGSLIFMIAGFLLCGYMAVRGAGGKRAELKSGDLFERVQAIARLTGVSVHRVMVFVSPKDTPAAFAQRTGAILLSDRLLRLLSRNETDAVIAHEAAHLLPRQRMVVAAVPPLIAVTILTGTFWPDARSLAPFCPFAALLLWRALRRMQEYDADATSLRTSGDPEALIGALTRISHVSGLPLHWGPLAGLFMPHPPMTARFSAIALKAGISPSRVEQLVSTAAMVPALPGYASPFAGSQPADCPLLSAHCDRLGKRMTALNHVFPIAAGVGWSAAAHFWPDSLAGSAVGIAAWLPAAMLFYWVLYEVIAGSERQRLRRQLPIPASPDDFFTGLSTAAEPRTFDNSYHYDLGLARIDGGSLHYKGARCSFSLQNSQVLRIWLANGPRHWTPRKVVCIEYQFGDSANTGIVSLQPLERWFWPGTSRAADRLLAAIERWAREAPACDSPSTLPPQAIGTIVPLIPLRYVWKRLRLSCSISLCIAWSMMAFSQPSLEEIFTPFWAPMVTAVLILFALAPHLDWNGSTANQTSAQPSASSEPS